MKYRIAALMCLLLLLLTGCKEKNDVQIMPEVGTKPVDHDRPMISFLEAPGLVVSDVEVQEDRVRYSLTNTAQNDFWIGTRIEVEIELDGVWYRLQTDIAQFDDVKIIKPGATAQFGGGSALYRADRFAPGNYRLVKSCLWKVPDVEPIDYPRYDYYLPFTIAE